jgi:hypothetical protein
MDTRWQRSKVYDIRVTPSGLWTLNGNGEMLEPEVTPGLLAGAEPDAHQFNVTIGL